MNSVHALTLDGTRASAAERERWALTEEEQQIFFATARTAGVGAALLSTCHRIELFADGEADFLWDFLAQIRPGQEPVAFTAFAGDAALRHLLRVASGLESAVLGEAQVLGQVRATRDAAQTGGTLTPALRLAFEHAIATGRRVRAQTALGKGTASVASAAVLLAQRAPGGLRGRRAVVVGAGEMGRLLLKHLPDAKPAALTLVSREGASQVAEVARPEALPDLLATADVVFTATTRRVISADLLAARAGRPITLIDLGLPRNVAADVDDVPGVTRYDIDAVGQIVDRGRKLREAAVPEAEALVEAGFAALRAALDVQQHEAVVGELRRKAERIRQDSIDYICGKCSDQTCREPQPGAAARCSNPEYFSRTLTNRLLHDLTGAIRQHRDVDTDVLRRVLGLDAHA